jgi:hypothetical protein
MKKPGSILRVQEFSDSENEEDNEEMEVDQSESEAEDEPGTSQSSKAKQKKKGKKGIIYISTIPQHMNVAICREFMECFGEVNRIFLQPDSKGSENAAKQSTD